MPPRDGKCCHHLATVRVWWHAASLCSRCHSSKCTQKRCTICNWSPKKIHIKCEYSIEKQESAPKANCLTSIYKKNLKWMSHFSQKHSNVGPRVKKAGGTHCSAVTCSSGQIILTRLPDCGCQWMRKRQIVLVRWQEAGREGSLSSTARLLSSGMPQCDGSQVWWVILIDSKHALLDN